MWGRLKEVQKLKYGNRSTETRIESEKKGHLSVSSDSLTHNCALHIKKGDYQFQAM